jgi:hypothetical protein
LIDRIPLTTESDGKPDAELNGDLVTSPCEVTGLSADNRRWWAR